MALQLRVLAAFCPAWKVATRLWVTSLSRSERLRPWAAASASKASFSILPVRKVTSSVEVFASPLPGRQRRLARDWAAYAAEGSAQDVEYALGAQADLAAEASVPYRAKARKGKTR